MKKALPLILALVLCLSLCACGGKKYVGTYVREGKLYSEQKKSAPGDGWYCDEYFGTRTLVLNEDGTGEYTVVADSYRAYYKKEASKLKTPKKTYEGTLTWEVIDGYLYMEGEGTSLTDGSTSSFEDGTAMYRLEAKSLQVFFNGKWCDQYTKMK